jgi:hypothetical protein
MPGIRAWIPVIAPVFIGLVSATYGFAQAAGWRHLLAVSPSDAGPEAGLLAVAIIGCLSLVGGLLLLTSAHSRRSIGPSLFVFGVGLTCGVAIGFVGG